jgi:hypothetical protein
MARECDAKAVHAGNRCRVVEAARLVSRESYPVYRLRPFAPALKTDHDSKVIRTFKSWKEVAAKVRRSKLQRVPVKDRLRMWRVSPLYFSDFVLR